MKQKHLCLMKLNSVRKNNILSLLPQSFILAFKHQRQLMPSLFYQFTHHQSMLCPNQFTPTSKFTFSPTFTLTSGSFDFCTRCSRFHPSHLLHHTQKTQKTESFKVQDSNIFDVNMKLAHMLKLSSDFNDLDLRKGVEGAKARERGEEAEIGMEKVRKESAPRNDWFSTASNSKKYETPTSCSSPKRIRRENIKLKPKHLNRRYSEMFQ